MSKQPLVSVRGEAVLEVDPELARVMVTVTARDADRATALRRLNERAAAVDRILRDFPDAIERIETTGVRVSPQVKNRKAQERISGYVASVQQTISVSDFTRLGELVARLADQDLTEVAGPWWSLRPDSPVYRRARLEATHDAVRRARDYAGAVGSELKDLVELADARLLSDAGGPPGPMVLTASAGGAFQSAPDAGPDEFTFDIVPARQTVQASVEARFRIGRPELAGIDDDRDVADQLANP